MQNAQTCEMEATLAPLDLEQLNDVC